MRKLSVWSVLCILLLVIGIACATDIALPSGEQVSGWVFDPAGEAIAGVQLLLVLEDAKLETQSSESGYFLFQEVSQGSGILTLQKEGYKPRQERVEVGEHQEFKIILEPLPQTPGILVGQILDAETGLGIWRVEVTAERLGAGIEAKPPRTFTDAKGYWRLSLPPGQYLITARHKQYQEHKEQVEVKAGEVASLNFKLVPISLPPAFIRGRVESRGARNSFVALPVPDARVVLTMENQHRWETTTDAAGVFQFATIPPGWGLVIVTKAGYKPWQEKVQLEAGATVELQVILEPLPVQEAGVYGQVKDMKTGRPVAFARILAQDLGATADKARSVMTDNQGYYKLFLTPGKYILEVVHPEYFPKHEPVELMPGQQLRMDFQLRPVKQEPSALVGMVYVAESRVSLPNEKVQMPTKHIAGAEVILSGEFGEYKTVTGPDGWFEIQLVEPGTYLLLVRKDGYQPYRRTITIPQGEKIQLKIPLLPGGTIILY